MEYMYKKIKSLLFHTLVPAVLGALMLPMTAFAQEDTISVSVPVEVQVSGSRIPSDRKRYTECSAAGSDGDYD